MKLNSRINIAVALLALEFLGVRHASAQAGAPVVNQTLTSQWVLNNSGAAQTNIELMFSSPLTNLTVNGVGSAGATVTPNTAKSWTVTGINVRNQSELNVRWAANVQQGNPTPTITSGMWTPSTKAIGAAQKNLPAPPVQLMLNGKTVSANFTNPGPDTVDFTNVQLFDNAPGGNFMINSFDSGGGTQVGPTTSFSLAPGGSQSFEIDNLDPNNYAYVLATADDETDPSDTYDMAAAIILPEPAPAMFMMFTGIALLALRRRTAWSF